MKYALEDTHTDVEGSITVNETEYTCYISFCYKPESPEQSDSPAMSEEIEVGNCLIEARPLQDEKWVDLYDTDYDFLLEPQVLEQINEIIQEHLESERQLAKEIAAGI